MQDTLLQFVTRGMRACMAGWLVLLPLLWTPVLAQDTDTEYFNVSASGSGYFTCRLDGVAVSQHSQEYVASRKAGNLKLANPDLPVICEQTKTLVAVLTTAGKALVAGNQPPDPPPDPVLGAVTLSWTAPTQNEDGTTLTDLAGYKLYWGTASGVYTSEVDIADPAVTTYVVEDLSPNTYHFAATAYNAAGVESAYSGEAIKEVP